MFVSLHFFIGKAYMFEHRSLSKNLFRYVLLDFENRLEIDHFQRCISEHFPTAYGGIHMKLLNLELFISKALTFHGFSFNFYVFIFVQDSGPGPPPSKLGFNSTPT